MDFGHILDLGMSFGNEFYSLLVVGGHSPFAAPVVAGADGNYSQKHVRVLRVEAHDAGYDFVDGAVAAHGDELAVSFLIGLLYEVDGVVFELGEFT